MLYQGDEMAHTQFIHTTQDVVRILKFASEEGVEIYRDMPVSGPSVSKVNRDELSQLYSGSFLLTKSQWIFGQLEFVRISAGYNKGKFFLKPRTNFSSIAVYFGKEICGSETVRLASGVMSRYPDWLRSSDATIQPSPENVKSDYNRILKFIGKNKVLRSGGQTYYVTDSAWERLVSGAALPPFEYIERPPL